MWELIGIAAVTLMIFGVVVMVWNHFRSTPSSPIGHRWQAAIDRLNLREFRSF
jgi:hypothetical protein